MSDQRVLPAAYANVSFGDIYKYIGILTQLITLFTQAKTLAVGAVMQVPPIKAEVDGKKYTLDRDGLTRTA